MSNINYYDNNYDNCQYTNEYNDFDGIFIDEDDEIDNIIKYGLPNNRLNGINGAIMTYNLAKPENDSPIKPFPNMSYQPPQNSAKALNIEFPMNGNKPHKLVPANTPIEVYKKSHKNQFAANTNRGPNEKLSLINPIAFPHFAGYVTSDRGENANIFYSTGWDERPGEFNSAPNNTNIEEGNGVQWLGANNYKDTFAANNNNYMYNNAFVLKVLLFIILIILICILCAVVANKKKYYNPIYEDYY